MILPTFFSARSRVMEFVIQPRDMRADRDAISLRMTRAFFCGYRAPEASRALSELSSSNDWATSHPGGSYAYRSLSCSRRFAVLVTLERPLGRPSLSAWCDAAQSIARMYSTGVWRL